MMSIPLRSGSSAFLFWKPNGLSWRSGRIGLNVSCASPFSCTAYPPDAGDEFHIPVLGMILPSMGIFLGWSLQAHGGPHDRTALVFPPARSAASTPATA